MATYIFDLDGTLVEFHTNRFLPGALDMLREKAAEGHRLIVISMRAARDHAEEWSIENAVKLFNSVGINVTLLVDVPAPRMLVDDMKPTAIHRELNQAWIK